MFRTLAFLADAGAWIASLGLVTLGAIAIGIYLPRLREIAFAVAIAAASSTFFMTKGVSLGTSFEKARWEAAEKATADRGVQVRKEAEHDVEVSGLGRGDAAGRVRNDPTDKYDRDRSTVRGVAVNHVQQPARHTPNRPANPRPQPGGAPVGVLGVIEPSPAYPCWRIRSAFAALTKEQMATISASATPEQRQAAEKCLQQKGK